MREAGQGQGRRQADMLSQLSLLRLTLWGALESELHLTIDPT